MKEYLEAQEQERKKPDDSLRRVTAERDALSRQLQQLKTDYAEGKKKWEEDKKWRAIYRVREEKALKERDNLQKKFDSYHELWVQARKKIAVQANDIKAKDAEISKINGLRSEAEKRGVDLGKDLNEAKQKLNDAEKIHATRQEQMEKKLSKAKELWTYHKELIELHFKKEADDVKNPIMEAFEKEFEMFKPDE
jgi:chromosome segregation ATPase